MQFPQQRHARPGERTSLAFLFLAWLVWAATAVFRFWVVLALVNPRHRLFSDAMHYVSSAFRFGQGLGTQGGMDVVWAPGTASLYAITARLDASMTLTALGLALMSCTLPLIVAELARTFGGRRAFAFALLLASLHPLYLQYATVFVSDLPFAFFAALTLLTAARTTRAPGAARWLFAAGTGAWATAAFLVRGPALSIGLVALAVVAICVPFRVLKRGFGPALVALALAFVLVQPAFARCRILNRDHFCPASVNGPMNIALGHAGTLLGLVFEADERGGGSHWVPPTMIGIHHYDGIGTVHASIFNTRGVMQWVADRFKANPAGFFADSWRNVGDLFARYVWLNGDENEAVPHAMAAAHQAFMLFVIVPGWILAGLRLVPLVRRRASAETLVLVPPLLGIVATAALTLGESRYRMPSDACAIALVALALSRIRRVPEALALPTASTGRGALSIVLPVTIVATISFVSAPATRLGPPPAFARGPLLPPRHRIEAAWLLGAEKPDGHTWVGSGVQRIRCAITCDEIVVPLASPMRPASVAVGVDVNDTYSVELLAQGCSVARAVVGPREPPMNVAGLRRRDVPFTLAPSDPPIDAVRVAPLFGDGTYALGYVLVTP